LKCSEQAETGIVVISVLHHIYILFVWNAEAGSLNEKLENQVENLKDSTSWNPRGRYLSVATERSNAPAHILLAHMFHTVAGG